MAEARAVDPRSSRSLTRISGLTALAVVGLFGARFWVKDAVPYLLDISAEGWGHYWALRPSFMTHIIGGSLALIMGPFQFWSGLRRKHLKAHQWTGRLYLFGIVVGTVGSVQLAVNSQAGPSFGAALMGLALAWVLTSGTALYAIRHRKIELHKQWMIRSYVVTFAFVTFRLLEQNGAVREAFGMDRFGIMGWASWVVPLLVTEVVFGVRAIRKGRV